MPEGVLCNTEVTTLHAAAHEPLLFLSERQRKGPPVPEARPGGQTHTQEPRLSPQAPLPRRVTYNCPAQGWHYRIFSTSLTFLSMDKQVIDNIIKGNGNICLP